MVGGGAGLAIGLPLETFTVVVVTLMGALDGAEASCTYNSLDYDTALCYTLYRTMYCATSSCM